MLLLFFFSNKKSWLLKIFLIFFMLQNKVIAKNYNYHFICPFIYLFIPNDLSIVALNIIHNREFWNQRTRLQMTTIIEYVCGTRICQKIRSATIALTNKIYYHISQTLRIFFSIRLIRSIFASKRNEKNGFRWLSSWIYSTKAWSLWSQSLVWKT